jgi:hypothetical protein
MRPARTRKSWLWAGAVLLLLTACSSSSSGPKGDGADDAGGDTTAGSDTGQTGDTAVAETGGGDADQSDLGGDAAQLVGSYELTSVSVGGTTLTTENQDVGGGVMGRVGGSLLVEANGRYTVDFTVYLDDSPEDGLVESGTWELPSAGRIRLDPDDDEPVEADYTYNSGTLTMEFDAEERGTFVFVKQG